MVYPVKSFRLTVEPKNDAMASAWPWWRKSAGPLPETRFLVTLLVSMGSLPRRVIPASFTAVPTNGPVMVLPVMCEPLAHSTAIPLLVKGPMRTLLSNTLSSPGQSTSCDVIPTQLPLLVASIDGRWQSPSLRQSRLESSVQVPGKVRSPTVPKDP